MNIFSYFWLCEGGPFRLKFVEHFFVSFKGVLFLNATDLRVTRHISSLVDIDYVFVVAI